MARDKHLVLDVSTVLDQRLNPGQAQADATDQIFDLASSLADPHAQLPVGDAVAQKVMSLPMQPYLDEASIERIVQSVANTLF